MKQKTIITPFEENKILSVIQFLRFEKTRCDSLNAEVYLNDIKPLILKLQQSKYQHVKEAVNLLIMNEQYYWPRKL